MSNGWIKLYRKLAEKPLWLNETFTRGQAWVDLLLIANHADGFIRVRGNRLEVKRGQVGWSEKKLAERWKWSRSKVRGFFKELAETEHQIEQQKNNISSVITITNYNCYQTKEQQNEPQKDSRETAEGQQKDTNKKNKKNKKVFIAPSLQEVTTYCLERKSVVNPQTFRDYYDARGWKYGTGKPMVDWKAAIRTWENKASENKKAEVDNAFS